MGSFIRQEIRRLRPFSSISVFHHAETNDRSFDKDGLKTFSFSSIGFYLNYPNLSSKFNTIVHCCCTGADVTEDLVRGKCNDKRLVLYTVLGRSLCGISIYYAESSIAVSQCRNKNLK